MEIAVGRLATLDKQTTDFEIFLPRGCQLNVTLPLSKSYIPADTFSVPATVASRTTVEDVRSNAA